jgi:TonB family protein
MGLDENAMEGVKRWRFNPATRNGEPVAVEMKIEVSFNLY